MGRVDRVVGREVPADFSLLTASSVLFDAVYVLPGAPSADALAQKADALEFIVEAFKHCKTIGAAGEGLAVLEAAIGTREDEGIVRSRGAFVTGDAERFVAALGRHRHWAREPKE